MSEPYRYAFDGDGPPDVTLPVSLRQEHMQHYDPETDALLDMLKVAPGSSILEVGAHDAPVSLMLAELGYPVTSIDLRDYDFPVNAPHSHVIGDFTCMPDKFYKDHIGHFDTAISISALEHFGLQVYGDACSGMGDISACRIIHMLLKKGGTFYVQVPFGGKLVERIGEWRVYDMASLWERIIQDFVLDEFRLVVAEKVIIAGNEFSVGQPIDLFYASLNQRGFPAVSAVMQLRKVR